jgi:outer membrane protein OmpA-like peptidoglycan-associated protein
MNEWRRQVTQTYSAEVELKGNTYYDDLRIEYYNDWLQGHVKLLWQAPENATGVLGLFGYAPAKPIPRKYLFGRKPATLPAPVPQNPPAVTVAANPAAAKPAETPPDKPAPKTDLQAAKKVQVKPVAAQVRAPAAGNTAEKPLPRLESGSPVVLKEVFFRQGEYTLLPESYPELDRLAAALQDNPLVRIEIHGHTDNVGDARLNQALSENRAMVVTNYLMRKGIAEPRIIHRGFGGSRPVKGNATEAEREQNRRVEFVVQEK